MRTFDGGRCGSRDPFLIGRTLKKSLREVGELPATELAEWERHFRVCAPGDYLAQHLLVDLIQTVEAFALSFIGGKRKGRRLHEIAPWLVTDEQWRKIRNEELERQELRTQAAEATLKEHLEVHAAMVEADRIKRLAAMPKVKRKRKTAVRRKRSTTGGKRRKT